MLVNQDDTANGVADHFAVIGFPEIGLCDEEIQQIIDNEEELVTGIPQLSGSKLLTAIRLDPRVLDQYPVIDNKFNNGKKLPEGMEYFCFPQGLSLHEKSYPPTFHSFVHTSEDGTRMIGCVLAFSEELTSLQYQSINALITTLNGTYHCSIPIPPILHIRKGICLLSRYPFINSFKIFLVTIFNMTKDNGVQNSIPIERFICNFMDDVPAPPPGKVDIKYFIGDETISFVCPPLNQPNHWLGYSIFPLFECLSAENIIYLLTLILTERQILFISSQYHLLTICAEIISSLIYPFRWAHAYIPVLPTRLLGALGAPFPFIFGIHHETYKNNTQLIGNETVKVFLDDNVIAFGALGLPPPIPEGRYKKLFNHINECIPWFRCMMQNNATSVTTAALNATNNNHYQHHHADSQLFQSEYWKKYRLPLFDDAYSRVCMEPMVLDCNNNIQECSIQPPFPAASSANVLVETMGSVDSFHPSDPQRDITSKKEEGEIDSSAKSTNQQVVRIPDEWTVDDKHLRSGFLNFFVTMLKDYKKYLVYPSIAPSGGQFRAVLVDDRFRFDQFLKDLPSDWQPLLKNVVCTQTFSQFVDDRVLFSKLDKDVIFFDESIDAKLNRYTFRWGNIDTPFLLYNQDQHIKTYVPPSPSIADLPTSCAYSYSRFPKLDSSLYFPNRHLAATFSTTSDRLLSILGKVRLKRKYGNNQGGTTTSNGVNQGGNIPNGVSNELQQLSGAACAYSSYLVAMCQFISYSIDQLRGSNKQQRYHIPSTKQLMDEYSSTFDSTHEDAVVGSRVRANSVYSFYVNAPSSPSHKATSSISPNSNGASVVASASHLHFVGPNHIGSHSSGQHHSTNLVTLSYAKDVVNSAKLALKVVFELLNSLVRMDYLPDEIVYRSISEACADLKESDRLIDLIVFLDEEGFVPAHHIRHALIRSMTAQQDFLFASEMCTAASLALEKSQQTLSSGIDAVSEEESKLYDSALALSFIFAQMLSSSSSPLSSTRDVYANGNNSSVSNRRHFITVAEIWSFTNWASLRRDNSTVLSRNQVAPQPGGNPRFHDSTESRLTSIFFGNSSNHTSNITSTSMPVSPTVASKSPAPSSSNTTSLVPTSAILPSSSSTSSSTSSNTNNQETRHLPQRTSYGGVLPMSKARWTQNVLEGSIPRLYWNRKEIQEISVSSKGSNHALTSSSSNYKSIAASSRLYRQVKIGEEWLMKIIPNVTIDLVTSPGMKCTGNACPIERSLTLQEIYTGWMEIATGDRSNKYTTKCIYCEHEFLPRFCIQHVPDSDAVVCDVNHDVGEVENEDGDESEDNLLTKVPRPFVTTSNYRSVVWCELLSPWTLYKEILNVIFEEGIHQLLSQQFKSRTHQSEVIFWNAIISFRLRGLPIAFFFTNRNIVEAFPPTAASSATIITPKAKA